MSRQHSFPVSIDFHDQISSRIAHVRSLQEQGLLPTDYSEFVDNLFKEFDTPEQTAIHAVLGISGEAGEITDVFKKVWVYQKKDGFGDKKKSLEDNTMEELGDLLYYFVKLANMFGFTLEQIIAWNMYKLNKRYHEGKFSEQQAIARADKVE